MADTQRTLAALVAILANNVTGDISAQDIRDMLVSLAADHAELYVSGSAETTIATKDAWVDEGSTWTLSANARNFSEGTNGRLQFDGVAVRAFMVAGTVSMTSPENNKTYEFGIGKNGTIWTPSIIQRKIGTGADVGAAPIAGIIEMDTGDYLTLQVRNTTDTSNVTVTKANISVVGLIE